MRALSASFENKSKEQTVEMTFDNTEFWEEDFFQGKLFESSMKSNNALS